MTNDDAFDEARFIVTALEELDSPHIVALTLIRKADDGNQRNPGLSDDEILQEQLKRIPYPVLAVLARTGVVRQGSEERENGLFSIPRAGTLSITGISHFGRQLLEYLESVIDSH
jgi:hypothetical protein